MQLVFFYQIQDSNAVEMSLTSPTASATISNKLLRHLQKRIQELRQENSQLKENMENSLIAVSKNL